MKNHGRFLTFIIFLIALPQILFASVTASVDYDTVELGDMVIYSLDVSGDEISRPRILRLCDTDVISSSSQTSMQVINGIFKKSYILSYKFLPQKTCEIKPISIEIDSKEEFTKAIKVTVKEVSEAKDKNFEMSLITSKNSVFVGETFDVTLLFKQKKNSKAVDSKFIPPELKGFWVKNESEPERYQDGLYSITKVVYTMAAQRVGEQKITKAQMRIASRSNIRDSWGAWSPTIRWKTYFSNELNIQVKALPNGTILVGDFSILATVDKTSVNTNEAINLNIEVLGTGNLEDIKSFKPSIDGVSVFDEKIIINGNKLNQKIAFVADRDFVIKPFVLKYFDVNDKKVKIISTNEIKIQVKNLKPKEKLQIQREEPIQKEVEVVVSTPSVGFDKLTLIIIFLIGLITGILIILIKPFNFSQKEKVISLKNPKLLLMKLLPYRDDKQVQEIVDLLEESIYSSKELNIDKKLLKEIFKKYDI